MTTALMERDLSSLAAPDTAFYRTRCVAGDTAPSFG